MEAGLCRDQDVVVVGAGNSAGQAALFLSQTAKHVFLLVRGCGLKETMSDYLVQRIASSQEISLCLQTEIIGMDGDDQLRSVTWCHGATNSEQTRAISNVFVMIGASPKTTWLCGDFGFDGMLARRVLGVLPPVIVLKGLRDRPFEWLELSCHFILDEALIPRAGAVAMISRLLDVIFVQLLRTWASGGEVGRGWLSGAIDQRVSKAMSAISDSS